MSKITLVADTETMDLKCMVDDQELPECEMCSVSVGTYEGDNGTAKKYMECSMAQYVKAGNFTKMTRYGFSGTKVLDTVVATASALSNGFQEYCLKPGQKIKTDLRVVSQNIWAKMVGGK